MIDQGDLGRSEFGGKNTRNLDLYVTSLRCLNIQVGRLNSHMDRRVLSSDNKTTKKNSYNPCCMPHTGLNALHTPDHLKD